MNITIQGIYKRPVSISHKAIISYLEIRDLPTVKSFTAEVSEIPDQTNPGYRVYLASIELQDAYGQDPDFRAYILDDCGESFLISTVETTPDNKLLSYNALS